MQVDSSQKHAHLSPNAQRAPRKMHALAPNAVEIKPRADCRALIGCAASVRLRCAVSVARTTRSLASDNCLDAFSSACSMCPATMANRVASALAGDAGILAAGRTVGTLRGPVNQSYDRPAMAIECLSAPPSRRSARSQLLVPIAVIAAPGAGGQRTQTLFDRIE